MPTSLPPSTDFTGSAVTEGGFKSAISAMRTYLAGLLGTDGATQTALATLGAPLSSYVVKSGAYTAVAGDKGKTFDCTGTWTFGLLAAATAGDGFTLAIRNGGTGVITVDPNLTETIDGGATLTINAGESLILYCTGTAWIAIGKSGGPITSSSLRQSTARMLGRTTASTGAIEEIAVAGTLTLSAGTLTGNGIPVDVGHGGVGCIALVGNASNAGGVIAAGATVAGSSIMPVTISATSGITYGSALSGTWRNLGAAVPNENQWYTTMQRIS